MTLFIQNDYRTKARTATFEDENQNTLSADILIDLYDWNSQLVQISIPVTMLHDFQSMLDRAAGSFVAQPIRSNE